MRLPEYKRKWLSFEGKIVNITQNKNVLENVLIETVDIERKTIFYRENYGRGSRGLVSGGVINIQESEPSETI